MCAPMYSALTMKLTAEGNFPETEIDECMDAFQSVIMYDEWK